MTSYYKQNDSILKHQEYKLLKVENRESQNYMKIIEKNFSEFINWKFQQNWSKNDLCIIKKNVLFDMKYIGKNQN